MNYEFLKTSISSDGTLTMTLNRPDVHNAFNSRLIGEITDCFNNAEGNDDVRLVVLTGEGRSFCAGADLNWMSSMIDYSIEENIEDSKKLALMFEAAHSFSKPVIGLVNGHALGGGVGLVSICDYALTHEKAKFGFTEAKLGLIPAVISPYCIEKIGVSNAKAWFMSGQMFNASKAYEMNLIHEVVSIELFEERSKELISSFLEAAPKAAQDAKILIENVMNLDSEKIMDYTCQTIAMKRISNEGQEGMKALLEKRKPKWNK